MQTSCWSGCVCGAFDVLVAHLSLDQPPVRPPYPTSQVVLPVQATTHTHTHTHTARLAGHDFSASPIHLETLSGMIDRNHLVGQVKHMLFSKRATGNNEADTPGSVVVRFDGTSTKRSTQVARRRRTAMFGCSMARRRSRKTRRDNPKSGWDERQFRRDNGWGRQTTGGLCPDLQGRTSSGRDMAQPAGRTVTGAVLPASRTQRAAEGTAGAAE